MASTIGVFGSSNIAYAAGSIDPAEPPAIIAPSSNVPAHSDSGTDLPSNLIAEEHAGSDALEEGAVDTSGEALDSAEEADSHPTAPLSKLQEQGECAAEEAEEVSLLSMQSGITDQASLMAAIESGETVIKLDGSFAITSPISISNNDTFQLLLEGHTLTCTGDVFTAGDNGATVIIMGSGTLKGGGVLVRASSGSFVSIVQMGGTVSVQSPCNQVSNYSYDLKSKGSLSLSRTLEMSTGSSFVVGKDCTFTSTAAGNAVSITAGSAAFELAGTLSASNNGIVMSSGTKLRIDNGAELTVGGNAIAAGANCDVSVGSSATVSAGGKVMTANGNSTGTSVESGPNVTLSDGTIAMYMASGVIVEFDHDKFVTFTCANPHSMGWYGSIDGIWCPTQADYDALLKKIPNGKENCVHYTATFNDENGAPVGSVSVRKGHCVGDAFTPGPPKAPSIKGKRFAYWVDPSGTQYDASAISRLAMNADTVYTAHYEDDTSGSGDNPGTNEPIPPSSGTPTDNLANPNNGVGSNTTSISGTPRSRTPRVPAPSSGWLPADLAMAAGFTVPTNGPGVVTMKELDEAAGAGGDKLSENPTPEASLYDARADDGLSLDGLTVARVIALAGGTVLAAVLAARVAGGFAASAKASRQRRRKALGLD